jgi:hypothetical protein
MFLIFLNFETNKNLFFNGLSLKQEVFTILLDMWNLFKKYPIKEIM